MFRKLAILAILILVVTAAFGSAAALDVFGGAIQGGSDSELRCDTDGIEVFAYGLNTYPTLEGVEYITVKGVSAACNGARLMGRLYTPGFPGGDYVYTSGTGPYSGPVYTFVIANGDENTLYNLYLKDSGLSNQVYVPAEFILEVKLWIEGDTSS